MSSPGTITRLVLGIGGYEEEPIEGSVRTIRFHLAEGTIDAEIRDGAIVLRATSDLGDALEIQPMVSNVARVRCGRYWGT